MTFMTASKSFSMHTRDSTGIVYRPILTYSHSYRIPPYEMLEKVEKVVNLAFQNQKVLRYRDQFGLNEGVET